MFKTSFSFNVRYQRRAPTQTTPRRRPNNLRPLGLVVIALAGFLTWQSHWFVTEKDLTSYPEIQLSYTDCRFEKITHYRSSATRQIVFVAKSGRYVMEEGVWGGHCDGPTLASRFGGGGTVHAWVHPAYPHVLRGIRGGPMEVPLQWGLDYDQRNVRLGFWMVMALLLTGLMLCFWRRLAGWGKPDQPVRLPDVRNPG